MNDVLVELFRHKSWATISLIELCEAHPDLIDTKSPGAFGTIRETLTHIVLSEEHYYFRLTGERVSEPLPDAPPDLRELAARVARLDPRWEELVQDEDIPNRDFTSADGWIEPGKVILAQAIHHAESHRTQVLSILGAWGIEVPELSLWEYAGVTGSSRQAEPAADADPE